MTTVWIGDFRSTQIQDYIENQKIIIDANKADEDVSSETPTDLSDIYLFEDTGDSSWFTKGLLEQLPRLSLETANVIFMLGFNDCMHSCAWDIFNVDKSAASYVNTLKELAEDYPNIKFYICSVSPVDADYPFAAASNGIITKENLNAQINKFNNKLKTVITTDIELDTEEENNFTVSYIDLNNYLNSTSFYTHDGVHFDTDTIISIVDYINMYIKQIGGQLFKERTEAPVPSGTTEADELDISKYPAYWLGDHMPGGLHPFSNLDDQKYRRYKGDVLPNCTGYAWGRFYEITGNRPTFCKATGGTHNAEMWYLDISDGYERGQEPALGAVICWSKGNAYSDGKDGQGHVAIVEKINTDGTITISESGWNCEWYWQSVPIGKDSEGKWYYGDNYHFQGFIYCPTVLSGHIIKDIPKEDVISRDDYLSKDEMNTNAIYIWNYLGSKGWTLNAVAGMLGNMQTESSISPNRCEISSIVPGPGSNHPTAEDIKSYAYSYKATHGRFPGYGLVQWTGQRYGGNPSDWADQKYISWCNERNLDPSDIDSQLERILWECDNNAQFDSTYTDYPMTFKEFSTSTKSADYLAKAFLANYERPNKPNFSLRGTQGMEWYNYLLQYAPAANTPFNLKSLKIDYLQPTGVRASFVGSCCKEGTYTIFDSNDNEIVQNDLTIKNTGDVGAIVFIEYDKLTPNTSYVLKIDLIGNTATDKLSQMISFSTPQDFPASFKQIKLTPKDQSIIQNMFQLDVTPSNPNFGYWKANGYGYTLQLIINGSVKEEAEVTSVPSSINIKDYFNYEVEAGDIVQIGIRTWVMYKGEKLYDSPAARTSNTICMLKKPIIAYLNTD